MNQSLEEREERDALAGEYVLGLLGPAEQAATERTLPRDRALRADVYHWQDRLLSLTLRCAALRPCRR